MTQFRSWLFQGNPDQFDVDGYLQSTDRILWSVRQRHYEGVISPGDEVFLWRASGVGQGLSGIVAVAEVEAPPSVQPDDPHSVQFWRKPQPEEPALRVPLRITKRCLSPKAIIKSDWLKEDPVLSDLRIFKLRTETNYELTAPQAQRLAALVRNTGRDWNRDESIAGLYAYMLTHRSEVSRKAGQPVSAVALTLGRALSGVYNKVMNFRALDPDEPRKGLTAGGIVDAHVWDDYYDPDSHAIDAERLAADFKRIWHPQNSGGPPQARRYSDFGEAPDDDPGELQQFARRVRQGQPRFRRRLTKLYGGKCSISGWGPEDVLEAAHIVCHSKAGLNHSESGLLLRADLHTLFDLNLLRIDPVQLVVVIAPSLKGTPYWELNGQGLRAREDGSSPSMALLHERWVSYTGS